MNHFKWYTDLALCGIGGAFAGLLVQLAQIEAFGHEYTDLPLLEAFGTVSLGILPWVVLGTALSLHSRCGLHAALRVGALFSALLLGYAFGGELLFRSGWCNEAVLGWGCLLLLPAAAAGWVLGARRNHPLWRVLAAFAGFFALACDLSFHGGFSFRQLTIVLPLLVFHLYTVTRPIRVQRSQAVFPADA